MVNLRNLPMTVLSVDANAHIVTRENTTDSGRDPSLDSSLHMVNNRQYLIKIWCHIKHKHFMKKPIPKYVRKVMMVQARWLIVSSRTSLITDIRVHLATISTQRQLSVFADDNDCRVVDPLCDFELATCNDICNLLMKGTNFQLISTSFLQPCLNRTLLHSHRC